MSSDDSYRTLTAESLPEDEPLHRYEDVVPRRVTADDPALRVMTDLSRTNVISTQAGASIREALTLMIDAGVRLLLVVNSAAEVVGLITARDLNGEKPVEFASRNRVPRDRIRVEDIMTPKARIEVLPMTQVTEALVGDIIVTLRASGRQHAVVVERNRVGGELVLRGIFSATQIGRELGIEIQPTGVKQSFSELEAALHPGVILAH